MKIFLVLLSLLAVSVALWQIPTASGAANLDSNRLPWPEPEKKALEKVQAEIKTGLPDTGFKYATVGPWVIATDLNKSGLQGVVDSTISIFGAAIQRQLFTKKPRTKPVKVYLFKDYKSYLYYNHKLFEEKPGTPYGFYSRSKNALVMNIGTGGGTLLHEMVHAMAEADYPDIPAWLNEGLGSLFEASHRTARGRVIGVTNWRLRGLKKALNKKKTSRGEEKGATPLSLLLTMKDQAFYSGTYSETNYATARYLMQWLQGKGKLETFYRNVRDRKDHDGIAALRAVLDNSSLKDIEKEYFSWARDLKK